MHPAKEQKRSELWQLNPVEHTKGDLKKQIAAVINPAVSMYRFQTIGEYRALLSLYNIGIEEVQGERNGQPYRGILYTALNDNKEKAEVTPLKSSLFGKDYGYNVLERRMERSGERIEKEGSREHTRHRVAEALLDAPTENDLRERLKAYHIDLFLRRNDTGRIVGVTFIDHENRCVLNGSRLGKEYSANAFNERYRAGRNTGADLHRISDTSPEQNPAAKKGSIRKKKTKRNRGIN